MPTVKDTVKAITRLQHRHRVVSELADFMERELSSSAGLGALDVQDCAESQVSEGAVEAVKEELFDWMSELEEDIDRRQRQKVEIDHDEEEPE